MCAMLPAERGVRLIAGPTDQLWGHRTLSFRDPDGNVLEIYAEIQTSCAWMTEAKMKVTIKYCVS